MKKLYERIKKEIQFIYGRPESFMAMSAAMLITSALSIMAIFAVVTGYTQDMLKNREATRAALMVMNLVMWVAVAVYIAMFFTGMWCLVRSQLSDTAGWKKGYIGLSAVVFVRVACASVWGMYTVMGRLSGGATAISIEKLMSAAIVLKGGYNV